LASRDPEVDLRLRATEVLRERKAAADGGVPAIEDLKLLHELQVHQIELELQNEELQKARADLATALDRYVDLYDFAPFAYITLGLQGKIRELNLACAALLGVSRVEASGRHFADFIESQDRDALGLFLEGFQSIRATQSCHVRLATRDRPSRIIRIEGAPTDPDLACRAVLVDITDSYNAEQVKLGLEHRLAVASEARYATILDAALIGVITIDDKHRIVEFNREAERIFGYSKASMIGASLDALIPVNLRTAHERHLTEFSVQERRNQRMGSWRHVRGVRSDGQLIPLDAVISKVVVGDTRTMTIILRDMSDIDHAERELHASLIERGLAVERAETANRAKSTFLAVMSHELRTPLNAVIGFSDMMINEMFGPIGDAHYSEYLADINRSGKQLLALLSDILDLSRIEAGRVEFEIEPVDLAKIWADLASTFDVIAKARGVTISGPRVEAPVLCLGDSRAIAQILTNLIGNAAKFTPEGGSITVTFNDDPALDEVAFVVRDTGRGIRPSQLANVTKPFVQVDVDAYRNSNAGVGLGLAICTAHVDRMHGRLEIESKIGVGTAVTVTLPRA